MHRLHGDERAGRTDGVTQRNTRTVGVDLGGVEFQLLAHGAGLGRKGFVGFDHVQVVDREAGALEHGLGGRDRAHAHDFGVQTRMGITHQARQRLGATRLGRAGFHQHHGRGRVVDARSVTGGDGAVFFDKHRFEFGQVVQGAVGAVVFVHLVGDLAFATFEHNRHDLVFEVTGFNRALGAVVAFDRASVLHLAADVELRCHVLGGHTHVDVVERVVQGTDHHVDHLGVAHARTKARGQAGVGRAAHVLSAAADGHVAVAQQNALAGIDDGLQARAAQAVDVVGRGGLGAAAVDGRHARQIHVFGFGVDHVAKHHMAHVFALGAGAGQGLAHHQGGEFGGWGVFEAAAKRADGGANRADHNNFSAHVSLLKRGC